MKQIVLLLITLISILPLHAAEAEAKDLIYSLPTDNKEIFGKEPEKYYMYVDRTFEGETSRPWTGGTFGFVRNAFRNSDKEIMYAKFHEGIDVLPQKHDAKGEPLDLVYSIAPGTVVYVNNSAGGSSYGRYLVIAHRVPEGIIFSLYAHMKSITVNPGQEVASHSVVGVLGYTGVGINRRRAHLHLELALMINSHYKRIAPASNIHDRFNGLNLVGFDPADILHASKGGKPVSISKYFSTLKEHYRVRVPQRGMIDVVKRHPFLYKGSMEDAMAGKLPKSFDISFTGWGLPIAVYPSDETVKQPTIIKCKPAPTLQQNVTVKRIMHTSKNAAFSASGRRYIDLFLWLPK